MTVTMTHPKLPGRTIEVPESGVGHRERAGWRRKTTTKKTTPAPRPETSEQDSTIEGTES